MDNFTGLKGNLDPLSSNSRKPGQSFFKRAKDFIIELIKIVVISLVIIIPIRHFLIQPFYVKGASMEPNFYDHEYLIIDEISYRLREPDRGEIIVFRAPGQQKQFFIKRIIGLPGEKVDIREGKVFINGVELDESGYLSQTLKTLGEISAVLREGEYFVLGDNRGSSLDSRSIGPISQSSIVGKTLFRGWPIERIKWFEAPNY